MSLATLRKLFADAIKNAIHAGRGFDSRLRPRAPRKPRQRLAYARGGGSLGEYDRAMRAYLEHAGPRPSRFVQRIRNTAL